MGLLEEPNLKHPLKMKGRNDQKADAQVDIPAVHSSLHNHYTVI